MSERNNVSLWISLWPFMGLLLESTLLQFFPLQHILLTIDFLHYTVCLMKNETNVLQSRIEVCFLPVCLAVLGLKVIRLKKKRLTQNCLLYSLTHITLTRLSFPSVFAYLWYTSILMNKLQFPQSVVLDVWFSSWSLFRMRTMSKVLL